MGDILLGKYNDNESNIHFTPTDFEPGKSEYSLKWTIKFNNQEQWVLWKIIPSTTQLPALRFALSLMPSYYNIISPPSMTCFNDMKFGSSFGVSTGIDSVEFVEMGGDIIEENPVWDYFIKTLIGTVAECNLDVTIEADFPIFSSSWIATTPPIGDAYRSDSDAEDDGYITNCVTGDMSDVSHAVNYTSVVNTIPRDRTYYIRNQLKKNGTLVETKDLKFQIPEGARIWLVADEHEPNGQTYNMRLYMSGLGLPPTFKYRVVGDPSWTVAHILTSALRFYYYGTWTDYNNGDLYKVVGRSKGGTTNIPIFADEQTGDMYGDGLIGEDASLNSGDLGYDDNISTGGDLSSTDIPNPVIAGSGAGVNVWLLDRGNLNSIMSVLYTDQQTIIDDIQKGTWLWGNNPIDFIVSIYYVPFNVSSFYDTTTERVWLGQYDTGYDYTQCKESKSSGQRITLVNTSIDNVYGDFRDIDYFKYDLFLPYVGFVPLDPNVYVGHNLKIEMAFDVMTHNIRYYLYCDNVVTDRIDGSVGYSIPITGTDQVNKAKSNLNGIVNTVKGGIEATGGVMTGNLSMFATGSMDILNGAVQGFSYPKEIIRGDISSSMNIYDINYVYLKITEKESIYPAGIKQIYNNPSYVVGSISNLSGYCEIDNVQISTKATEPEINEILSLLRGGVII